MTTNESVAAEATTTEGVMTPFDDFPSLVNSYCENILKVLKGTPPSTSSAPQSSKKNTTEKAPKAPKKAKVEVAPSNDPDECVGEEIRVYSLPEGDNEAIDFSLSGEKPTGYAVGSEVSSESKNVGEMFSSAGPAPYTGGDILDDPDLLWTEDTWTEDKEKAALERIALQGPATTTYWKEHYEAKAGQYWHHFYQRNSDNFYKDRHYIHVVFPELAPGYVPPLPSTATEEEKLAAIQEAESRPLHLLEVGCGVGNAVTPLLTLNPRLHGVAFDFAKSGVELLRKYAAANLDTFGSRLRAEIANVVTDPLPVENGTQDFILCMFVLSAIGPTAHQSVFQKLFDGLRPGGKLLLRDYGRYDEAQLRFKKGSKIGDNFYVRQDGTCSYFFSLEDVREAAENAGFVTEELYFILRQYANRQQRKARYRVWVHGKFRRPTEAELNSSS